MTTHTKHFHGAFSWVDLSATDTDAAMRFYGQLFGWDFVHTPASKGSVYVLCMVGGRATAAIKSQVAREREEGAPPHWACYFSVDDVDLAASKVERANGKVILGPLDLRDLGRKLILSDPSGASAMLWQAGKHIGATVTAEPGAIVWAELLMRRDADVVAFWKEVVGWTTVRSDRTSDGAHTSLGMSDTAQCGVRSMPERAESRPSIWVPYFEVNDSEEIQRKALSLGATVHTASVDVPKVGRLVSFEDPQGAVFGVRQKLHD